MFNNYVGIYLYQQRLVETGTMRYGSDFFRGMMHLLAQPVSPRGGVFVLLKITKGMISTILGCQYNFAVHVPWRTVSLTE